MPPIWGGIFYFTKKLVIFTFMIYTYKIRNRAVKSQSYHEIFM